MFVPFLIKMSDLMSQLTHNSFFITLGGDNKTFDKLATDVDWQYNPPDY